MVGNPLSSNVLSIRMKDETAYHEACKFWYVKDSSREAKTQDNVFLVFMSTEFR